VEEPLNAEERYLHAIITRLDAITQILSGLVQAYAEQHQTAYTNQKIEEKPAPKKTKKK